MNKIFIILILSVLLLGCSTIIPEPYIVIKKDKYYYMARSKMRFLITVQDIKDTSITIDNIDVSQEVYNKINIEDTCYIGSNGLDIKQ